MRGRGSLIYFGLAAMGVLFFLSEPGSKWLAGLTSKGSSSGAAVARVVQYSGQIKRVRNGQVDVFTGPSEQSLDLFSGERLEVDGNSSAVLLLSSNDEFELGALTAVALQLWNERDLGSAIYLTVISGDAVLKKPGVKGKAYIVREGRLFLPGQTVTGKPLALTVLKTAPLDLDLASEESASAPKSDFEAADDEVLSEKSADESSSAEPETLSNEYIDGMIAGRQAQLQKCWILRLKDNPDLKGQIVLQFEISRRGKVKEIKVADATLEDDVLKKCAMDVVERISFRPFKGSEISLTYPINFE